jgi:hypothetical protein
MADELNKAEQSHELRMDRAVRAIRNDGDLRYLVRQYLHLCGTTSSIDPENTNRAMYQLGRQSAGQDFQSVLMASDPTLYADLAREDALQSTTETTDET